MRRIHQRDIWHDRYLSLGWRGVFDEDWKSTLAGNEGSSDTETLADLLKVGRIINIHPRMITDRPAAGGESARAILANPRDPRGRTFTQSTLTLSEANCIS